MIDRDHRQVRLDPDNSWVEYVGFGVREMDTAGGVAAHEREAAGPSGVLERSQG
jgi:hypothetical protein